MLNSTCSGFRVQGLGFRVYGLGFRDYVANNAEFDVVTASSNLGNTRAQHFDELKKMIPFLVVHKKICHLTKVFRNQCPSACTLESHMF